MKRLLQFDIDELYRYRKDILVCDHQDIFDPLILFLSYPAPIQFMFCYVFSFVLPVLFSVL